MSSSSSTHDSEVSSFSTANAEDSTSIIQVSNTREPVGLPNLGYTCYINTVLQLLACLNVTERLTMILDDSVPADHFTESILNTLFEITDFSISKETRQINVFEELRRLVEHVRFSLTGSIDKPDAFAMQDAQELLSLILDKLFLTVEKYDKDNGMEGPNGLKKSLSEHFEGTTVYKRVCKNCRDYSVTKQSWRMLQVHLNGCTSVQDAANEQFGAEELEGARCEKCGNEGKMSFCVAEKLPRTLFLHAMLFDGSDEKNLHRLRADERIMLKSRDDSGTVTECTYRLQAVAMHNGNSVFSGHYFAFVSDNDGLGGWTYCDDATVSAAPDDFITEYIFEEGHSKLTPYIYTYAQECVYARNSE